jgi:hypothetical protein
VATPAVNRPCCTKYRWKSSGSTPWSSPLSSFLGGALNIRANSRSKAISSSATAWRSSE